MTERTSTVRLQGGSNNSGDEFRGKVLRHSFGMRCLEMGYVVGLCFEFFAMHLTVPYSRVLALVIDPLLPCSVESMGI